MGSSKRRRPIPVTKKPPSIRSRKKARRITTAFHKLTSARDRAISEGNAELAKSCTRKIESFGGVRAYQQASQLSTSFHSTSKWVIAYLTKNKWIYGIGGNRRNGLADGEADKRRATKGQDMGDAIARPLRLLEVGAINTELVSMGNRGIAGARTKNGDTADDSNSSRSPQRRKRLKHDVEVRAIDIHSMHASIEEINFLDLPLSHEDPRMRYDVIVCSMVINCVTTPQDRGLMLAGLFHHLRPGGICFLTLPKSCLTRSECIDKQSFCALLAETGVGFVVTSTRETEKVSFFICERPQVRPEARIDPKWTTLQICRKASKATNKFGVVLRQSEVDGNIDRREARKSRSSHSSRCPP